MDDRLQSCNPRAVSAIRNGKSPVCVARVMGVHLGTVYGWLARYRSGGWGMFEARKRGGRMTMAYDAKNQMTYVSNATWRVWNTYDHIGRRIQKRTQYPGAYGSAYEYKYLYDGWNMIAETINTAAPRHYLWGLDLSGVEQGAGGVGGLLGFTLGTNWFIPLYDATGNITGYVNASLGRPVINYEFDAYANLTTGNGISIFRCRFSTKHFDTETGLCYYGRRFYDPIWGRWLNRDPIEESGGLNLYAFYRNNPVKYFDALGDTPLDVRAARIRAYLGAGAEEMAADEALLLYRNIAWGGEFVEPLAASLMKNWLDGAPEDPFTIPSRHVKRAMLYDEPAGTSPKDQLESQLCALVPNPTSGVSGSLSGSALDLRATQGVYYHAFGGFKITFTGTYGCNRSARCKFKGNWEFYDKYDWHDGLDATVAGTTIPGAWALLVEECHGAKLFEEDGNWRGTVKVNCPCTTASSPGGR